MSKKYYIIPIFVPHEGCPHNCIFCNQHKITGIDDTVTAETVERIADEYLKTIDRKNATVEISFFGGTFTAIKEEKQRELLEVAKRYKDSGRIDKIRMSTRPDYINEYILTYLKEYDVDIIELGVQSLVDEVLVSAGRGHSVSDVQKASELIKKFNIILGHQIMPGLPNDNFEFDILTTNKSIEMRPDIIRIYPALVIKETPMETMYNRGEYVPYTIEQAVEISKIMYKMYEANDIQVIRIGLQPTETINDKEDVVAGPFHPAFRELVQGSIYCEEIRNVLKDSKMGTVEINPKEISKLYANKKQYFNKLKDEGYKIKVITNEDIKRGEIKVF